MLFKMEKIVEKCRKMYFKWNKKGERNVIK